MIPRFRAYDSGSCTRMYEPYEVMVGDGDIWVINEDDDGRWIVNNDLHLMQSTGFKDKNDREIFEGDIIVSKDVLLTGVIEFRTDLGMFVSTLVEYNNFERLCNVANSSEIIGNIYTNPELAEVSS